MKAFADTIAVILVFASCYTNTAKGNGIEMSSMVDSVGSDYTANATAIEQKKQADALGLYDMLGNVAEWTISGSDPLFFTVGGSYESDKVHCSAGMMDMAHGDVALGSLGLRLAIPAYELNQ